MKKTTIAKSLDRKWKLIWDWSCFIVRNTIAFLLQFVFFFLILLITGIGSMIYQFDGSITTILFIMILTLFSSFIFDDITKRIVRYIIILKSILLMVALCIAFQYKYSLGRIFFSLCLIGSINVMLSCLSIKNLYWIKLAKNHSIMEDKLVYQSDNLTQKQRAAFDQLEYVLSNATQEQSFSIVLIGDCGSIITNSLYTKYCE